VSVLGLRCYLLHDALLAYGIQADFLQECVAVSVCC
jgi:hypothetical protein